MVAANCTDSPALGYSPLTPLVQAVGVYTRSWYLAGIQVACRSSYNGLAFCIYSITLEQFTQIFLLRASGKYLVQALYLLVFIPPVNNKYK